ncbi:protein FAM200A-like [Corythoichthys intestinalis]|uniref:protein FAM200A-like n=1 Tax=Corythoichthys intestinalis TaxID=161448 RepID=UPI0025A618DB|nr:protein FAM200A-like [Corythoichthys intestinalis]
MSLQPRRKQNLGYFPVTKDPRTAKEWIHDLYTTTLPRFWIKVISEYPDIARRVLKTVQQFPTSYLCEAGFSHSPILGPPQRNKLRPPTDSTGSAGYFGDQLQETGFQ